MASCASEPRRAALSQPSPISTALTAWMRHEGLGQEGVELAVPVHVAAEADRHAVGQDLGHAAERVAVLGRRLDRGDHRLLGRRVEAAHRALVDLRRGRRARAAGCRARWRPRPARTMWLTIDDPEVAQQQLGQRAGRHPGRGLAGRGPLEHVAGVVEAVLLHPGQVGVARAGAG